MINEVLGYAFTDEKGFGGRVTFPKKAPRSLARCNQICKNRLPIYKLSYNE